MSRSNHIIVTGGGSGAGAVIAQTLAAEGHKVTILGRTETSLKAQGLSYQLCDVTVPDQVDTAFAAARAEHGPISVVIANAGGARSVPFHKMTADDLTAMTDLNLLGVFNVWKAALTDMKDAGWGRMIAIASTAGLKGYAYVSGYSASKHGVIGLTRSLALELAQSGITVNAICPGFLETPMLSASIDNIMQKTGKSEAEARAALCASNPQKRFVSPEEVASTVSWLITEGAASVNGHALALSGGEI